LANELWHSYASGNTLYAIVRQKSDDKVNVQGGNTFETWVNGNILTYDHPMADNGGDYYSVDFPSTIDISTMTTYRIDVFLQAGANPVVGDDIAIAQGEIYWDGTSEADVGTITVTNQTVTNVYDESTPPPVSVIDESIRI